MWPQASLHFYQMLIQKSSNNMAFTKNQDYPYIILSNIPTPDLIKEKNDIRLTIEMVNQEAQNLEKAWAQFLVMSCNTMHLFKSDIMKWLHIPFLSMIDCVTRRVQESGIKKVWLLWSTTTMQSQLYATPLQKAWVEVIIPEKNKHNSISQTIHNYIAEKSSKQDIQLLEWCCDELVKKWVEIIILWCTELPLILQNSFLKYTFLASSEVLAESTLEYSET